MKVLVVGSGAREHALTWKLAQSPLLRELFCAPGNPGIARVAECLDHVPADDVEKIATFAAGRGMDLVVVGPEKPLTLGLADALRDHGVACFGPSRAAAEIEGSKAFAKELMRQAGIPTARAEVFDDVAAARSFVAQGGPWVVKADGLAAGKGVYVCEGPGDAARAVDEIMMARAHGDAGARVVIEERLAGEECSFIALCDGERVVPLAPARDHKRVFDGDRGPNTGGMGAYSPVALPAGLEDEMRRTVFEPALRALAAAGRPFVGALYAGLMLTREGPRVLEFNARFGDPETQPLMMRFSGDLLPLLHAAATGNLEGQAVTWDPRAAVAVVMAAQGYPGRPRGGDPIRGLETVPEGPDLAVFHGGTAVKDQDYVTAGGRVLTVCALGRDLKAARMKVYDAAMQIRFEGAHYRTDIGQKLRGT